MNKLKEALDLANLRGTSIAILQKEDAEALQKKVDVMVKAIKEARDNCDSPHACSTVLDHAMKELGIDKD